MPLLMPSPPPFITSQDEMRPAQLSRQCHDNWPIRESDGELDHLAHVLLPEPTSVVPRKCGALLRRRDTPLSFARLNARLQHAPRTLQLLLQQLGIRQHGSIVRRHDRGGQALQRIPREGVSLVDAEDQAHGRIFIMECPVFLGVVAVQVHLAHVGMGQATELQVDDDEAAQAPMDGRTADRPDTRYGRCAIGVAVRRR